MVKQKNDVENEAFQGCDSRLKSNLVEVVNQYDEMFQEPKGFPPQDGNLILNTIATRLSSS